MMSSSLRLKERQNAIVSEFSNLKGWEDRYKHIIDLGKALPDLPDQLKTEEAKVKGCQSQVWLHARLIENGQVEFRADSDAMIVRGLVALLMRVYSLATPDEILQTPPDFVRELGFESNLSPSRANGLHAMIRQIKYFAMAFKALSESRSTVKQ